MARKRNVAAVDSDTGEVLAEGEVEDQREEGEEASKAEGEDLFPDVPEFQTPEDAVRAISKQSRKVDRLEQQQASAKAALKDANAALEREQDVLRQMTRGAAQLKLFKLAQLLLLAFLPLLAFAGCGQVKAQGSVPFGTWDDLHGLSERFELIHVDDGVGIVFDHLTSQGWMVVGCSDCANGAAKWEAITFVGAL